MRSMLFTIGLALTTPSLMANQADLFRKSVTTQESYFTFPADQNWENQGRCNGTIRFKKFRNLGNGVGKADSGTRYDCQSGLKGYFFEVYTLSKDAYNNNVAINSDNKKMIDDIDAITFNYPSNSQVDCDYYITGLWGTSRSQSQAGGRLALCVYAEGGKSKFRGLYWYAGFTGIDDIFDDPEFDGLWNGVLQ